MRVCLVSYEFPPFGGGEGTYTHDLAKALSSNGVFVTLITPKWEGAAFEPGNQNVSIVYVNPISIPGLRTTSFMLRANRKLREMVESFDLVHYTNDYCGFGMSGERIGKPVVATLHHTHFSEATSVSTHVKQNLVERLRFRITEWLLSRLERSTLKNADRIVAVSQFTAKSALLVYPHFGEKIRVVLNGVDERRFSSQLDGEIFRKRLGIASQQIVLYVGRIAQSKGLDVLVKSFRGVANSIPEVKLVIIGSGSEKDQNVIRKLVVDFGLGSSVIFVGRVDDDKLPNAYAASDLVVLPSLVEGFGLVLLEAMAESRPVVATDVGPTTEVVRDGVDGVIVPSSDVQALEREIVRLLLSKSERVKMGQNGRKRVEETFTLSTWSAKMIELYRDCLTLR